MKLLYRRCNFSNDFFCLLLLEDKQSCIKHKHLKQYVNWASLKSFNELLGFDTVAESEAESFADKIDMDDLLCIDQDRSYCS